MAQVAPFHTNNAEDHRRSPVWHDNDQCHEGKRIKPADRVDGKRDNKCLICTDLDKK